MLHKIPFKCENVQCRFHTDSGKTCCQCNETIIIDDKGCKNFEKGYIYYINLVWNLLRADKYIPLKLLDEDSCIGIYLVMVLFNLNLEEINKDNDTYYILTDEYHYPQDYSSITSKQINFNKLNKILDFEKTAQISNMPQVKKYSYKNLRELLTIDKEQYGWLSPTGEFFPGEYGYHILLGKGIIRDNEELKKEYLEWRINSFKKSVPWDTSAFLIYKGYILIDRPDPKEPIVVTNGFRITKKQKDFLYDYFSNLGDYKRANSFMED